MNIYLFKRGALSLVSLLVFSTPFLCEIKLRAEPQNETEEISMPPVNKKRRDSFARSLPVPVRVPGEFGRLSAVLLSANEMVHFHPKLFANLVDVMSERVPVIAIVAGPEQVLNGREALEEAGVARERVHFLIHHLDSMWIRDFGPIFLRRSDGTGVVLDTYYRARDGDEFRTRDDQFPRILASALELSCFYVPMAMEGGNFVHNGIGFGVSTKVLVERNEFRNFGGREFNRIMNEYFMLKSLTLVPSLPDEPTGHADMFITFPSQKSAVVAEALPGEREDVGIVLEQTVALMSEVAVEGRPLDIHRIPLPPRKDGFWRSYTNVFYMNGTLLVPSYSDVDAAIEREVHETYTRLLPDWEIKAILADELIEVGGFLHCLTLGLPHFIDPEPLLEWTE